MWQKIENKEQWDSLISSQKQARFLQSWQWGKFQASLGRKVLRFSWNNQLLVQVIKMQLPFGRNYWYIPQAPVIISQSEENYAAVMELAKELGQHNALFLRVDPIARIQPPTEEAKPGRNAAPVQFIGATQPQCTSILDLSQSEEELLSNMHQKTRYNIRLSEKKGVNITEGTIEEFIQLNNETKARDKFTSHEDSYYQKMVESSPAEFIKIWQATFQNKVLASNIMVSFGDTVTYTHGASSNKYREAMAPYLLHWHIIKFAKAQGLKYYDFWGVNPDQKDHPTYKESWQGISRFKAGFGGKLVCYPHSFDLIFKRNWYRVYRLMKAIQRLI
jgi:peptidoglycan pentaglycine glycine transferase (the first glycine)